MEPGALARMLDDCAGLALGRFGGAFPRAAQLEDAIAAVEDELMRLPAPEPSSAPLFVEDSLLHERALASGFGPGATLMLGIDDVERLISRLVSASHGV